MTERWGPKELMPLRVMAGLGRAIQALITTVSFRVWIRGSSPRMTHGVLSALSDDTHEKNISVTKINIGSRIAPDQTR
jgi:hypothetical protein